jgi:hypothetical protein
MSEAFSPRELGLLAGYRWAELQDAETVRSVAANGFGDDLGDQLTRTVMEEGGMRERLDEFGEESRELAHGEFWRGFVHGVRAAVVESTAPLN